MPAAPNSPPRDPSSCIDGGGTWMDRRRPEEYETTRNPLTGSPQWNDEALRARPKIAQS